MGGNATFDAFSSSPEAVIMLLLVNLFYESCKREDVYSMLRYKILNTYMGRC